MSWKGAKPPDPSHIRTAASADVCLTTVIPLSTGRHPDRLRVDCPRRVERGPSSAAMKAPVAPPFLYGASLHHCTAKIEAILTAAEGGHSAVSLTNRAADHNLPAC
jgi:hypothetical protein